MAILCALLGLQLHLYLIKARENFSLDFHQAAWNCLVIQDLHTYFLLFRPKYLFWLPKGRKQRTLMRTHWKPWQSNFTLKLKHLWMLRTSVIFGMILAVLSTIRRSWTLTHCAEQINLSTMTLQGVIPITLLISTKTMPCLGNRGIQKQ